MEITNADGKDYDSDIPFQKINHLKVVLNSSIIINNGTLKTIMGFQQNKRREFGEILFPDEAGLHFLLNTINYDLRYIFPEKNNYNFTVGINGMSQGSFNEGTEYLVPEYSLFDAGVFAIARKNIGKVDISGGIRYDRRTIESKSLFLDSTGIAVSGNAPDNIERFNSFDKVFTGVSGSFGLTYQISKIMFTKVNLSAGFRAPNIAELGVNGLHEGTFRYEIGNENLSSEKSIQTDLAFGINTDHVTTEIDLFRNSIDDFVFLSSLQSLNGSDSLVDGASAFKYISGNAILRGGEILLDVHPHPLDWLHFENSFSYVEATQKEQPDSLRNLPLIPAPKISTDIRISSKKLFKVLTNPYIKIGIVTYLEQDKIYSAYGTETKTPGYTLFNASIGTECIVGKSTISIHLSVSNLTDVAYQSHLSRLKYAPVNNATGRMGVFNEGRSVGVKLGIAF
jgi:iron complex outermembrane receptor protein